jgi:hypothetical protein
MNPANIVFLELKTINEQAVELHPTCWVWELGLGDEGKPSQNVRTIA